MTESGPPTTSVVREWRYDPWRESPRRAFAAAIVAVGLCLIATGALPGLFVGLALCLLIVGAFAPAFVPVGCRVDADGVAVRGPVGWRRRAWSELRRLDELPAGALLSPYARRHVLDAQRAILVPLPADARADLLGLLRAELERHDR